MQVSSFLKDVQFDPQRAQTCMIAETTYSREIRILLSAGLLMKEHQAPLPILIHVLEGHMDLSVDGKTLGMQRGDIISLDAQVPHSLSAHTDTIIRLTLSKKDQAERVHEATV